MPLLCTLRVCDGTYDDSMIRAWDQWDKKHISENDHPTEFAEKQVAECDDSFTILKSFS